MHSLYAHDYDEIRKKDRYSPVELAELLDVELGTIYKWNHYGKAPRRFRDGKRTYYTSATIIEWIEFQKRYNRGYRSI